MLKQVAVFVENQPGSLRKVTTALHEHSVSIYAFNSYDTPEFCILRMVVDNPVKAKEELTKKGFVTRICDVIAIRLEDEMGVMDKILGSLMDSNVNINYIYSSFGYSNQMSAVILHTDDAAETEEALKKEGYDCINSLF